MERLLEPRWWNSLQHSCMGVGIWRSCTVNSTLFKKIGLTLIIWQMIINCHQKKAPKCLLWVNFGWCLSKMKQWMQMSCVWICLTLMEISLFYDLKRRNRDFWEKAWEENKRRKTAKKWESSEESKVPFEITTLNQHHIHFCFCQLPTHFLF